MMRKLASALALGLGAAGIVLLVGWAGWLDTAELKAYDLRLRANVAAASVHPDIVLVGITDQTIEDFAPNFGRWPWPRAVTGLLIDYLRRAPARVVAVDLTFTEPEREARYTFLDDEHYASKDSDRALADAVRRSGSVIMLADAVNPGKIGGENTDLPWSAPPYRLGPAIEERPVITPPYPDLTDAAAGFGHNFLALDADGPARRFPPFVRRGDRYMPSLGLAAALAAARVVPEDVVLAPGAIHVRDRRIPLVPVSVRAGGESPGARDQLTMLINYRAPAHVDGKNPYPFFEVRHLVYSELQMRFGEKPEIDPATFRDKIVFVGLTASGLVDVFQTPLGSALLPGIQLHATVADSFLSNRFMREAQGWTRLATTIAGSVIVAVATVLLPFAAAAIGTVLLIAAWTWATTVAMDNGLWLNFAQPAIAATAALFAGTAYRYFVEGREKRKMKRLFGRYVSRDVYQQLIANPDLAKLGGRRREMSVLFSDIRGFTAVTERGNPEELVLQLNEYFSQMVDVVFKYYGTVDKFVGDMVMALFSAPLDDPRHAEHAVGAALEMVRELGKLNEKWASEGRPQLDIGIGINSGEMIAGNIGSSSIMSYTVIGDNVNLGSRLESLNKEYRTRIIISDATRSQLTGSYDIRPLGEVVVKGKTRPVAIFEVAVPSPLTTEAGSGASQVQERAL